MLPTGTLRYLKGHPDAIVSVVLAAAAFSAMVAGVSTEAGLGGLIIAGTLYHVRRLGAERHAKAMAQAKVDTEVAKVELVKARHRDLLLYEQPMLPLDNASKGMIEGVRAPKKGGKK